MARLRLLPQQLDKYEGHRVIVSVLMYRSLACVVLNLLLAYQFPVAAIAFVAFNLVCCRIESGHRSSSSSSSSPSEKRGNGNDQHRPHIASCESAYYVPIIVGGCRRTTDDKELHSDGHRALKTHGVFLDRHGNAQNLRLVPFAYATKHRRRSSSHL